MAVLEWQGGLTTSDWSDLTKWYIYGTTTNPTSLGASDTYLVQVGSLLSPGINLNTANLGHLFLETRGAPINVSLSSYNAKSIVIGNNYQNGCPLNLTQSATTIALDGTHSGSSSAPNYGYSIQCNGSLSSTSSNGIDTLKFTLGGSTTHHLPSSGQLDCQIEVLSGSNAKMQPSTNESLVWANSYSPGSTPFPIANTTRLHDSLRLHSLILPTNTTTPTSGGNQSVGMHNGEGVELQQYVLEVGHGNTTNCGIVSTNNPLLTFTGIKLVFHVGDTNNLSFLPCDNYLDGGVGTPVQNTDPDSCITVLLEDVELRLKSGISKTIVKVPNNMVFRAVFLIIGAGIFLQGDSESHIELIQKPTIRGTWNFEEQTDGFYKTMDKSPITSTIHATHCEAHILKELRVDGYIKVKERALAPSSATGFGMFWVDDASPNTPMFTDDAGTTHNLLSGGGGGGSTLAFKTIAVAGQSDVVADSTTDTLTLAAGSNMTITTNASTDTITFASASGVPGITLRDEGTPQTTIGSAGGSINFVGAGVTATSASAGDLTVTIPGGGGGGGGYPLFKHDELPVAHGFSPFRLLTNGDTIEIGVSTGGDNNKDVSVFTPTDDDSASCVVTATHIGSVASNTGREYIFYGQGRRGSTTKYVADSSSGAPLFVWVNSMRELDFSAPFPPINDTLIILNSDGGLNNVRAVDAGEHTFTVEEEPFVVRVLLITGFNYCSQLPRGMYCNYNLDRS